MVIIRKVIFSVFALAISLALIISSVLPVLNKVRETGDSMFQTGKSISPSVEQILK